jgi:hypothetical protein
MDIIICRKFVHLKGCSEEIEMKNEILEEVWKIKDEISKRNDFNIDKMVKDLKKPKNDIRKELSTYPKRQRKPHEIAAPIINHTPNRTN